MQDSSGNDIDYERLDAALARNGYLDAAAECHGALCGSLCVIVPAQIDVLQLLASGERASSSSDPEIRKQLAALREQTLAALQDSEMAFQLLLPDDEVALVPRARALSQWCEGFLFGLASKPGLDLQRLSEEAREIVRDFTEFTQAVVGDDEDSNIEETAYAELVEYVRVGAQLLFMELHPRPTLDPSDSRHLH